MSCFLRNRGTIALMRWRPTEKAGWRGPIDLKKSYSNIQRAFGFVWQAHAPSAIGMAAVTLISALLPVSQAWMAKLIVDGVAAAAQSGAFAQAGLRAGIQPVLPYLIIELALVALGAAVMQGRVLFEHVLHARLSHTINTAIIRKSLSLDLQFFEDPEYYDRLQNARREADWRALSMLNNGFSVLQNALQLVSFAMVLLAFSPWVALLLFGASLPMFFAQGRFSQLHFRLLSWRAPEARRASASA